MDVAEILRSWSLEDLIPVFRDNLIDIDLFCKLTPDIIKELIPCIGKRISFQEKFSNLVSSTSLELDKVDDESCSVLSGQELVQTLSSFSSSRNPHQILSKIIDCSTSTTTSKSSQSFVVESKTSSPVTLEVPIEVNHAPHASSSVSTGIQHHHGTLETSDIENTQIPFHTHNNVECAHSSLEDLLHSGLRGKIILSSYEKNGKRLTNQMRDRLVEIIIEKELAEDSNKHITSQKFVDLANAIVAVFPSECKEVYFTKFRQIKNGKTTFVGRGKLFFKYYNYRQVLKNNNLLNKAITESLLNEESSSSDSEAEEDTKAYVEWLKHNKEPFSKVEDYWKLTFKHRKTLLAKLHIHEYFKIFPVLQSREGCNLFSLDFQQLHPESDVFYKNWNVFADKILQYARCNYSRDKLINKLILEIDNDRLSEEGRNNRILKCIPYLVKPVAVSKKWKPSRTEIDEGFIMHVKAVQHLQEAIEQRENKLKQLKLTFQPTPIIVGADLDNIRLSYVRVNNVLYEVESPLKAVEVTFKAFHALNAIYSEDSEQVWLIIQKGLFRLDTKFDKSYTSVTTILPYLVN